ncbi:MAG TPA: hypothetical protein QGH28_09795, partial [Chloroflexota bacterium]|nr:hypothetical protein [Chloroflexota bacterium]
TGATDTAGASTCSEAARSTGAGRQHHVTCYHGSRKGRNCDRATSTAYAARAGSRAGATRSTRASDER